MTNLHSLAQQPTTRPHAWILDDSPAEAELIRRALVPSCSAEVFTDGAVLIEALARPSSLPDVLLLDWEMPGLSGIDVCKFLRGASLTSLLPILMVTANQRPEDVAEGMTAGANDYVFKPFNSLELSARVHALVRWDHNRKQLLRRQAEAHQRTLADEQSRRLLAENSLAEVQAAEEAARRSEERYRLASWATRDVIWEWDVATDALEWSVSVHTVFGHAVHEGPTELAWWSEHLHPEDRERVVHGVHFALRGHVEEWQDEYRFQRGDGTYAHVMDRALVVRDAGGRAVRMVGAKQDITERKQAEAALRESERRNRAVLTSLAEGVTFQDARGVMRMANASAERLLGLSVEQLAGRTSLDPRWRALREDGSPLPGEEHPPMVALRTGQPQFDQVMGLHHPDGTRVWLSVNAQPLLEADGRTVAGVVSSFFDITERKRFEEETRRRTDFERQLIGIVSHDLRTPLSAIMLAASTLQRTRLEERQAKNVERVLTSAGRANRMIRDLLDFTQARLGEGIPIHRGFTNLHALAQAAADEAQPAHPERRIELVRAGDGGGEWDSDRLGQVLSNLLGNALHYSPPGTPVRVETRTGEAEAVIHVHNQGAPIPPEAVSRLFEPLERGTERREGDNRSIGLGLFIVESIVRAPGGSISVHSTAQEGTTFTVRLPHAARAGA